MSRKGKITPNRRPWRMAVLIGCFAATQALANDVDLSISSPVTQGQKPALRVKVNKAADRIHVRLGSNGAKVEKTFEGTAKGKTLELPLPQQTVGVWSWKGSLDVSFADGSSGRMPLGFTTEVRQPPWLRMKKNGLNLKENSVTVVFGSNARNLEIEVTGEDGAVLAKENVAFRGERSGTPLKLRWQPKSQAKVMKISLVAHDQQGFFSPTLSLYPWSLAIPHEEVVFETSSNELLAEELPKLKEVYPRIQKRISQYQNLIPVRLFVLGHTDSVGPAEANRSLSRRRATAIAKWFQSQGVRVPIFIRGFGESDLRVATPDNTDELRNRRVDYILAVDPPQHRPWSGWVTIQGQKPSGGR